MVTVAGHEVNGKVFKILTSPSEKKSESSEPGAKQQLAWLKQDGWSIVLWRRTGGLNACLDLSRLKMKNFLIRGSKKQALVNWNVALFSPWRVPLRVSRKLLGIPES